MSPLPLLVAASASPPLLVSSPRRAFAEPRHFSQVPFRDSLPFPALREAQSPSACPELSLCTHRPNREETFLQLAVRFQGLGPCCWDTLSFFTIFRT